MQSKLEILSVVAVSISILLSLLYHNIVFQVLRRVKRIWLRYIVNLLFRDLWLSSRAIVRVIVFDRFELR